MDFQHRPAQGQGKNESINLGYSPMRGETQHNTAFSMQSSHLGETEKRNDWQEKESDHGKIVSVLEAVITVSLIMLFFGLSLFFTGLTLQGILFEKQLYFYFWILLASVAWVSKGVIVGEMKIRRTPLDIPILLFWVIYGLEIISSVDRWHSFWGAFGDPSRGFMGITALVIAYYIIVSNFTRKKFIWICSSLVAADFVLVVWFLLGAMKLAVLPDAIARFVPISPLGSLTGLGIFLSAMLPVIAMLIFELFSDPNFQSDRKKRIAGAIFLFLILIANLFSMLVIYSFVLWLGALIGVSFFLIYILAQIMRPERNLSWIPMFVFVAILGILMVGNNSLSRVQLPVEVSPSYQLSWEIAKNSLKENLLVGSGPATYGYDFSLFRPQSFNLNPYFSLRFFQGSGIFFEALSTLGIVGTFALILLALTFLSIALYLLSTNKKQNKIYSLGIFSAALIVLINSFAGKTEGSIIVLGVLLSALTVITLLFESEAEENNLTLSLKASPKYALALAFVFMVVSAGVVFSFVFLGKIYIADLKAGSAVRETKITENGSVKKLAEAINWNNRESRYYTLLGQELMSLANDETKKSEEERKMDLIQNYLNSSIASVSQARNLSPKDVVSVEALAQIYENSGLYVTDSFKLSEENYRKALELEPHNPLYYVKLGQIKLVYASKETTKDGAEKIIREAAELFQKAIDEKGNLAAAHYQLALSKEALGDLDGAIASIEQAAVSEQNNVNYIFNVGRIHQARGNDDDMKIAEAIYKNILKTNDKDANVHFSLGLLYEKTKRKDEATSEYKKVLDLISTDSKDVRTRIEKMISNIARGIENNAENLKIETENPAETLAQPEQTAEEPSSPAVSE